MLSKRIENGFTLMEVVVVMSIIAIISMVIVPASMGYINKAKERVCEMNCLQIERMYDVHLEIEDRNHSDIGFNDFLLQYKNVICPGGGYIAYVDGEVMCEVHQVVEDNGDIDDEVPSV